MSTLRKALMTFTAGVMLTVVVAPVAQAEEAKEPPKAEAAKDPESKKVQEYAEALKAQDAEAHKKFIALREAREKSLADLKKAQKELKEAVGEDKMGAFQTFRIARKKYGESYMAFLDFLDERDRKRIEDTVKRCQEAQDRIKQIIEARKKAREELEKAMKAD